MSIFLQTADGDFALSGNHLALVDGIEEVKQRLTNNFRTFQGEEPLDPSMGVPYIQQIFEKQTDPNIVRTILQEVAENTDGVLKVENLTLFVDTSTRKGTVTFNAQSEAGPIPYAGTFP